MRVLVFSALVAIVTGCGARSELGLTSSTSDGGAADADNQPDAAAPDALPLPSGCRASLMPGAPTPMQGYCSTRANVAPRSIAESRPEVRWSIPLGGSKEPRDMVVDPSGRTHLVVDLGNDSAVVPHTVMALGPDGEVVWTETFADPVGGPLLLDDGLLRVWQYGVPPSLIALDANGAITNRLALPEAARPHPAVGSDGSLVFALMDYTADRSGIAKLAAGGGLEWSHPALGRSWASVASDASDRSVLGTSGEVSGTTAVMAFDASGTELWRRVLDGYGSGGPVIGPDGSVVVSLGRDSLGAAAVVWLDERGEVIRDIDLGVAPTTVPEDLVVAEDGVVITRTWSEVVALSPTGSVLWRRNVHPNLIYDAFAGQQGGVVITSGDIFAVEIATGRELWQVVPSDPFSCVSPVVLSVDGTLVAGQCDGSVFQARP